ncbi:sulfotransferase family cytosolic 1B member 1-like [Pomacea canaliculata]|uniref:sulfotransferase family cytosolic 1B member 1-like n=1 Tax=Pomacea canaliculata TaxID=400727 RepID=UPI000D738177|nr:sulfotransferase family cytosolic 1B member 1-like [Pomacea canaliculata]XP_025090219.1 sulfotransferase family cytosolic 1B member 1-like [Pomacea canaliculata]XP_025090220.1 sulfotransferase family cytosolic 1B member 1-like [Pomacea canaliculata]XP_025090221.1 sulfotransferase family cytosolic 1B member 1-like [Pomacea canaliculata]
MSSIQKEEEDSGDQTKADAKEDIPAGTLRFLGQDPRPFTYILEGWALPPHCRGSKSWEAHITALRRLPLRNDDIFVLAYPKAGTHWLWEVISMLMQGKAEYDVRPKEHLMVEMTELDKLTSMPSPRVLNSHLPFFMLPWQQMKERRTKVVFVYRNPKDSCVSYYHHLGGNEDNVVHGMEFKDFCDLFFQEECNHGNYFTHLKQVFTFTVENKDMPMLSLSFEDMKKNPVENVKKLAVFLELNVSDSLCEEIADACSFNNLKKGAELKVPVRPPDKDEDGDKKKNYSKFYRKGEIGDWKNYFTVAMSEKMDAIIKERMEGLPYVLQYS